MNILRAHSLKNLCVINWTCIGRSAASSNRNIESLFYRLRDMGDLSLVFVMSELNFGETVCFRWKHVQIVIDPSSGMSRATKPGHIRAFAGAADRMVRRTSWLARAESVCLDFREAMGARDLTSIIMDPKAWPLSSVQIAQIWSLLSLIDIF